MKAIEIDGATIRINPNLMEIGELYKFNWKGDEYAVFKTVKGEILVLEEWDKNE